MSPALAEVYRDDVLLVVDKPAGMPSQRTAAGEDGVYELLCRTEPYVALHHRLDRRASGLLVVALDRRANKGLAAAFRKHRITRVYRALCEGDPGEARWDWPIEGKPARTDVVVVGSAGEGLTEIACTLHTGRTHQIRIHAAMAGTPLAGDRRYGGDAARPWDRIGLHAHTLGLVHPLTRVRCTWTSAPSWRTP